MIFRIQMKPLFIGVLMGPMMLAMLHSMLIGDDRRGAMALLAFAGIHVLAIFGAGTLALCAARFAPRMRAFLTGLHRPTITHAANMLAGTVLAGLVVHLYLHGGL